MNAKEKANELMHYYLKELLSAKYSINGFVINDLAKQCALIAVEEIINSRPTITDSQVEYNNFWNDVKSELQSF
jgi:hypothetical protein